MTELLKQELARIGDTVAPVYVAPDTWARGRRARRRDRVLARAAVLVLIAMLGGVVGLVRSGTTNLEPAVPGEDGIGWLPSAIYDVPDRLVKGPESPTNEVEWDSRIAETDLAVGRSSVAFLAGDYGFMPVVITAADGRYHPLALPGWLLAGTINAAWFGDGMPLALAPDGRSLAYAWWDPDAPLDRPMPAGVRVLNLQTGVLRTISLYGGNGVRVETIAWSPDSRWLAWRGKETKSWTPMSSGGGRLVAGRIAPDATTSEALPQSNTGSLSLTISSEGRVAWLAGGRLAVWDGGERLNWRKASSPNGLEEVTGPAAWAPDDDVIAFGSMEPMGGVVLVDSRAATNELGLTVPPQPANTNVRVVQPLGWIDATHFLMAVQQNHPDGNQVSLAIRSAPLPRGKDAVVTTTDFQSLTSLSVAVDLITDLDHPTNDFPEPDWPWSTERKLVVGALAVIAAGLAVYLLKAAVRRRRR